MKIEHFDNWQLASGFFNGKRVVVSGEFATTTKSEISEFAKSQGAYIRVTLSDNVDFVVIGANSDEKILNQLADLLSDGVKIKVLTETQFFARLNGEDLTNESAEKIRKEDLNFVAVDFENSDKRQFACALGVAIVKCGEIVDTKHWLIRPPENSYGYYQTQVHGITSKMTRDCPEFPELYEEIAQLLTGQIIIAHNYGTDRDVMHKTCEYYNLPKIKPLRWECTYETFNAGLDDCCRAFDIELNHHNAASDAVACAKLFILSQSNANLNIGLITHTPSKKRTISKESFAYNKLSSDTLAPPDLNEIENKSTVFFGNKVVITGKTETSREDLAIAMKTLGADIQSAISKLTNIVVVGDTPGPSKMAKIQELKDAGYPIQTFSEQDVIDILKN